ncbi:hypothetical protein QEH59_02915 [Coraliomargarita sp. SDUM461004]|uniref:Prepilin-type N-terminal cleavage/methylation domain-containing protein n=1 Tax=Thalassobacterium sedimentorum TaxID=3041258 RepID=A0ABU1AEZ6_9BACT|nr:hypothetical protein [Coraliomargarita sp. SDUM461004]MDQ8193359.1 hypothetical protein [Coraliomargarita sp. SDUM461004]
MYCLNQSRNNSTTPDTHLGFSLVEVVISLFILALFVLAFTKGLTYTKYTAEDNLYETTALTVAVSTIEQMKSTRLNLLETPPTKDGKAIFTMIIEGDQQQDLFLDVPNTLQVPIVTEKSGAIAKTMDLEITPSIQAMSGASGYWLSIRYAYEHPNTGRVREAAIHNARSTVPTH